jgi:hypothetical protein
LTCRGCQIASTGDAQLCKEHGCHYCGMVQLADCEDWDHPLCFDCFVLMGEPVREPEWKSVLMIAEDFDEIPGRKR